MSGCIVSVCLHMTVNGCIHKMIKSQKALASSYIPDIKPFSCMQKIEVTGASDSALLLYTKGVLYSIDIYQIIPLLMNNNVIDKKMGRLNCYIYTLQ